MTTGQCCEFKYENSLSLRCVKPYDHDGAHEFKIVPIEIDFDIFTTNPETKSQIEAIAADLTERYGEYGKRYSFDRVAQSLWKSLDKVITEFLEDLESLTTEDIFDKSIGDPETWDDPDAVRCTFCNHPRGDHEDNAGACNDISIEGGTCPCGTFCAPTAYQTAVDVCRECEMPDCLNCHANTSDAKAAAAVAALENAKNAMLDLLK